MGIDKKPVSLMGSLNGRFPLISKLTIFPKNTETVQASRTISLLLLLFISITSFWLRGKN